VEKQPLFFWVCFREVSTMQQSAFKKQQYQQVTIAVANLPVDIQSQSLFDLHARAVLFRAVLPSALSMAL
jgi:hypothetical protein